MNLSALVEKTFFKRDSTKGQGTCLSREVFAAKRPGDRVNVLTALRAPRNQEGNHRDPSVEMGAPCEL